MFSRIIQRHFFATLILESSHPKIKTFLGDLCERGRARHIGENVLMLNDLIPLGNIAKAGIWLIVV